MEPQSRMGRAITCQREATFTCSVEPEEAESSLGLGLFADLSIHHQTNDTLPDHPSIVYACLPYALHPSVEPLAHKM